MTAAEVADVRAGTGLADRAKGERHTGTPEGEMRYQGAPSAIDPEATRSVTTAGGPGLSEAETQRATQVYFERCAGCHGVLRKGATGKPLTPDITREKGHEYLKALITYGSPAGMPNWGTSGELQREDSRHHGPLPAAGAAGTAGVRHAGNAATWKVLVPPEQRPTKTDEQTNIDNFFA